MRGASFRISLSRCWYFIRCHFPISILFRLGKAGRYCVTQGSTCSFFACGLIVSLLKGCFPVGEFYLREVFSHNSGRVASFYLATLGIFDISLKCGLRGSSSEPFSCNEAFLYAWWVTRVEVK